MTDSPGRVGLCRACRHARVTGNLRGSTFYLCTRSYDDPRFPRYPPLPVLRCAGFEPGDAHEGDPPETHPGDQA